jgi:hypothetical protein
MNRKQYLDAIQRESAGLAALIGVGERAASPEFDGGTIDTSSTHGHAASLLQSLARHQMQAAAASLMHLSRCDPSGAAASPACRGGAAASAVPPDADVIDVQAVDVTPTVKSRQER